MKASVAIYAGRFLICSYRESLRRVLDRGRRLRGCFANRLFVVTVRPPKKNEFRKRSFRQRVFRPASVLCGPLPWRTARRAGLCSNIFCCSGFSGLIKLRKTVDESPKNKSASLRLLRAFEGREAPIRGSQGRFARPARNAIRPRPTCRAGVAPRAKPSNWTSAGVVRHARRVPRGGPPSQREKAGPDQNRIDSFPPGLRRAP
jgi:hypothetical protein